MPWKSLTIAFLGSLVAHMFIIGLEFKGWSSISLILATTVFVTVVDETLFRPMFRTNDTDSTKGNKVVSIEDFKASKGV